MSKQLKPETNQLGMDIVQTATKFEESLAVYLEAEAEKIRALSKSFDSNYSTATKYDINDMNNLFKETLDSIHSIKKSILENMVLGSTLMNSEPDESIPEIEIEPQPIIEPQCEPEYEPQAETEPEAEPQPESPDLEEENIEEPSFIGSMPELENVLKDLNIENLFTDENLSEAKDIFNQLTENLDFSALDTDSFSKAFDMFSKDMK